MDHEDSSPSEEEPAGLDALHRVAEGFADDPQVELATMFRSPGLRVDGKIFAFLGGKDRLIVKLPRARAAALLADGAATEVTMGTRTMREWVAIPLANGSSIGPWRERAREAYDFVSRPEAAG